MLYKLKRFIKISIYSCILGAVSIFAYKIISMHTSIIPFPYYFKNLQFNKEILEMASNSHVLIVGDQMGAALKRFNDNFTQKEAKNLRHPLKVFNWSQTNEGLHRTVYKIKSLKKLPPLIIYHGASQEHFEKRFNLKNFEKINYNIDIFYKSDIISTIIIFPFLSRIIYKLVDYIKFKKDIIPDKKEYSASQLQKKIKITYNLFEMELISMINYIKDKGSKLLVITPPINLDIKPITCSNAITDKILKKQEKVELLMKTPKLALIEVNELLQISLANAKTYYLYAQVAKKMNSFRRAKNALYRATAYSCTTKGPNIIFNKVLITKSEERDVGIIDFDRILNRKYGKDILFLNRYQPQEKYYNKLVSIINGEIKNAFDL